MFSFKEMPWSWCFFTTIEPWLRHPSFHKVPHTIINTILSQHHAFSSFSTLSSFSSSSIIFYSSSPSWPSSCSFFCAKSLNPSRAAHVCTVHDHSLEQGILPGKKLSSMNSSSVRGGSYHHLPVYAVSLAGLI